MVQQDKRPNRFIPAVSVTIQSGRRRARMAKIFAEMNNVPEIRVNLSMIDTFDTFGTFKLHWYFQVTLVL